MRKMKFLGGQAQTMRNILIILALFVCTSICLGYQTVDVTTDVKGSDIAGNELKNEGLFSAMKGDVPKGIPRGNIVNIKYGSNNMGNVYGSYMVASSANSERMSGNKVNVNFSAGTFKKDAADIYGAYACGKVLNFNNNTVTIIGGVNIGNVHGAYMDADGAVGENSRPIMTKNKVVVSRGSFSKVGKGIIGGAVAKGVEADVIDNKVEIDASIGVTGISGVIGIKHVYGGHTSTGTASLNEVEIKNVIIDNDVFGGVVESSGTASDNRVSLNKVDVDNVLGGRSRVGDVVENRVIIKDGKVRGGVFGGRSFMQGDAIRNAVEITSGTKVVGGGVRDGVFGGVSENGNAKDNRVKLIDVSVSSSVYGGLTVTGTAFKNEVTIDGGEVQQDVAGGRTSSGTASKNEVLLKNWATINNRVFGGYSNVYGDVVDNTVTIDDGTVKNNVYGGCTSNGNARDNKVTMIDGNVQQNIYGGYVNNSGDARDNTVTIDDGTVKNNVYGGCTSNGNGNAVGNEVTINNGSIGMNVYGGCVNGNGSASNNTLTIKGGKINNGVYGGFVVGDINGDAVNNKVIISGRPEFSAVTILCGGICADTATYDQLSGNTLKIVETKEIVVKGISNFEKYEFHLSEEIKPEEDIILTATSGGCSWDKDGYGCCCYTEPCAVELTNRNIRIVCAENVIIDKGARYTLINSIPGFSGGVEEASCTYDNGGLVEYKWDLVLTRKGKGLAAILTEKKAREEKTKPLLEGYGAGIACTNNGMDCILSKVEESESLFGDAEGEIGAFGGLAANKSRYNTGSHIDMIEMSMMGGVGVRVEVGGKEVNVGAFGEHGTGYSDIHCKKESKCESSYVGGGVLGKYDIYEFSGTKVYVEAILKAGRVRNIFEGNEVKNNAGKEYEYDMNAIYRGAAVGGGCGCKVSEKIELEGSLRYMFGYQGGKDKKLAERRTVKFENVISKRIRVGIRGKYGDIEQVKPYVGIGYEHELSGKVKAVVQDGKDRVDIPASSFGGETWIGEIGAIWNVWKLDVDISGQGYAGIRKGIGGMLKVKYAFGYAGIRKEIRDGGMLKIKSFGKPKPNRSQKTMKKKQSKLNLKK